MDYFPNMNIVKNNPCHVNGNSDFLCDLCDCVLQNDNDKQDKYERLLRNRRLFLMDVYSK